MSDPITFLTSACSSRHPRVARSPLGASDGEPLVVPAICSVVMYRRCSRTGGGSVNADLRGGVVCDFGVELSARIGNRGRHMNLRCGLACCCRPTPRQGMPDNEEHQSQSRRSPDVEEMEAAASYEAISPSASTTPVPPQMIVPPTAAVPTGPAGVRVQSHIHPGTPSPDAAEAPEIRLHSRRPTL